MDGILSRAMQMMQAGPQNNDARINQGFANGGQQRAAMMGRFGLLGPPNPTPRPGGLLAPQQQPGQPMTPQTQGAQTRGPGMFGGARNFLQDNSSTLMGMGAGILENGLAGGPSGAFQGQQMDRERRTQVQQQNATVRALTQMRPDMSQEQIQALVQSGNTALLSEALRPPAQAEMTSAARNLEAAGYTPGTPEFQQAMRDQIFGDNTNLPAGYRLSADGMAEPIPGSPQYQERQDAERQQAEQQGARSTSGDVVFRAASRALEASRSRTVDGVVGRAASINPETDNAEVYRQTQALQDIASAEALNAMRRQSPTGGALGNVTERELGLLARQSGALDPASPNYERDLRDYTLAVYQTIHGYEAGTQLFEQELGGQFVEQAQAAPQGMPEPDLWEFMTPEERALWN